MDQASGNQLHLSILSEDNISAINLATLEILERTGVYMALPRAREMLRGAGARVDGDRVRIPSFLVDSALRSAPRRVVVGNRDGERTMFLEGNRSYFIGFADCPLILDPFIRSRRDFSSPDYRQTARVVDACPNLWGAVSGSNAPDYPAEVQGQAAFKHWIVNTKKALLSCPLDGQQMADIYEMAAVIAGGYERLRQAPFVVATAEPTTPLGMGANVTEVLLLAAKQMMPLVWYPMPSSGTTAPCTPAGTLAVANAEVLAGLVLHQLERPGAPFIYGAMPGMTDMRTTQWSYGSPELALHVAAATDLAHSYGLPMYGTAGCTDAYSVDQQAVAEAAILCMLAQLSGANLVHDVGLMGGARLVSPEMMVLCDELVGMVDHATRRIDTGHSELVVDLVDQVGPSGNYLASEHTLGNFRRFWYPSIFLREQMPGPGPDEPQMIHNRINAKTKEIIETHEVEPLPDAVLRELDEMEREWMSRAAVV